MPSTFSSRASDENSPAKSWNGERAHDDRGDENAGHLAVATAGASLEELREELAVARRRLQYYEGFAPWIEEQMAAVVERAAEVAGESEREQARLAEEIERRNAEVERLADERNRLREEAKTIVAEANSTAEGVISEANAAAEGVIGEANVTAARLLAEARQHSEAMVSRLRDEAVAIVGRALGDLTALEAANSEAPQAAAPARVDEPADVASNEPEAAESTGEWDNASDEENRQAGWASNQVSAEADEGDGEPASGVAAHDKVWTGSPIADERPPAKDEMPAIAAAAQSGLVPEEEPVPAPTPQKEASPEPAGEPGPFQWLRTALAGRDASPRKDSSDTGDDAAPQDSNEEDIFVTRLVIHPSFTADERQQLQERIRGFAGIQRTSLGAVEDDFFELLVTHQLFTSMLGSLLTAAGEHIRLIAQHDDSLEVEVTALDWVREGAAEAGRGSDG